MNGHPVHPCIRKGMAAACRWTGRLLSQTAPGPTLTAYCGAWLTSIAAGPGALIRVRENDDRRVPIIALTASEQRATGNVA